MKKILLIILLSILTSGCSLIPRVTFDAKNTVPQAVDRSKIKETCRGKTEFNIDGSIVACSKDYYNYQEGYSKVERKTTWQEKITNFFRNLTGNIFWVAIALMFLFPTIGGWFIGRVFNATNTAFDQTVRAIKKFREQSTAKEELDNFLRAEQDVKTKQLIAVKRASP